MGMVSVYVFILDKVSEIKVDVEILVFMFIGVVIKKFEVWLLFDILM